MKPPLPEEQRAAARALARQYRSKDWETFRRAALQLAENRCERCGRGEHDRVVLQVHHRIYRPQLKLWEYSVSDIEVLCRGCHARHHGKVMPFADWEYAGEEDLGEDGAGSCELCGTSLRYLHTLTHARWSDLHVGCDCADLLTGSFVASEQHAELTRRVGRRRRFVSSPRWRLTSTGERRITQEGRVLSVAADGERFLIAIEGVVGKHTYGSVTEAQAALFDAFEDPKTRDWLKRPDAKRWRGS